MKKQSITRGIEFRQSLFLRIFLPHLDNWGETGEDPDQISDYHEFLWELTEVLLMSIYHWAEHELKGILLLLKGAPPEDKVYRLSYDDLKEAYEKLGVHLEHLKSAKQLKLIRLTVNAIKHNGSRPSRQMLGLLGLPLVPQHDEVPTAYYGLLTSPAIEHAMLKELRTDREPKPHDYFQRTLLEDAVFHVQALLRDLIDMIHAEKFAKIGGKARLWPPAV